MRWSSNHDEKITCYCHHIEEVEVVVSVVVVSKIVACSGWIRHRKLLIHVTAGYCSSSLELEKKVGWWLVTELRRETRWWSMRAG